MPGLSILLESCITLEEEWPRTTNRHDIWYTKAAEQRFILAQYRLGEMYRSDYEIPKDYKIAAHWYTKAANQGYSSAQTNIGYMYCKGLGVAQNFKTAIYWYTKAAKQGNANAQSRLGDMYYDGEEIPQNYKQAYHWLKKAAEQGVIRAQVTLGIIYYEGQGIPKNYKYSYAWLNVAATQGVEPAKEFRELLEKELSYQQLSEAQGLSAKIQNKIDHQIVSQVQESQALKIVKKINSTGTGFIITKDGHILTCHHVIKDATEIKIAMGENEYPAKLVRDNPNNDLALLKINGSFPALAFSQKRTAKMGEEVFTVGYPNPSLQGINAKFTKGTINSLTGFHDDIRLYQVDMAVQPGNSGGALFDGNGNILGIIMAMLDAKATFKITGSLPQNVNYAIKSIYALAILDTIPEISTKLVLPSNDKSNAVDRANQSTVIVICYNEQ